MLKVHAMALGDFQTNCYIIHDETSKGCCVIDPGYEAEIILDKLSYLGLTLEAVLLTHGHFDHVGAVEEIVKTTGCRLWMHEGDYTQFHSPESSYFYPIHDCTFTSVCFCEECEVIEAGGLTFHVMETPGHTWGSVCFLSGNAIFSGDTLFAGSCGRTDLPGGDWATIHTSLKRLSEMENDYTVYPGHGESTTLAAEKQYNPYLR